jgi:hypothetical protein
VLRVTAVVPVLSVIFASCMAVAFSGSPPDGRTGAPGETTCADCHGNLNVGSGSSSGDFIYADTFSYDDTSVAPEGGETTWGRIKLLYR